VAEGPQAVVCITPEHMEDKDQEKVKVAKTAVEVASQH